MNIITTTIIFLSSLGGFTENQPKAPIVSLAEVLNLFTIEMEAFEPEVDNLISTYRFIQNFNIDSFETELEEEEEEDENHPY